MKHCRILLKIPFTQMALVSENIYFPRHLEAWQQVESDI